VQYVNLSIAPLWECISVAALSIVLLVWRSWKLFEPDKRVKSALIMAIGATAYTCSVLARRESFGQGVALLALVAVSFWLATIGRIDEFAQEVAQSRRAGKGSGARANGGRAGNGSSSASTSVVRRLAVIACLIAVSYWLVMKYVK
jgi:hypothetical protein